MFFFKFNFEKIFSGNIFRVTFVVQYSDKSSMTRDPTEEYFNAQGIQVKIFIKNRKNFSKVEHLAKRLILGRTMPVLTPTMT